MKTTLTLLTIAGALTMIFAPLPWNLIVGGILMLPELIFKLKNKKQDETLND